MRVRPRKKRWGKLTTVQAKDIVKYCKWHPYKISKYPKTPKNYPKGPRTKDRHHFDFKFYVDDECLRKLAQLHNGLAGASPVAASTVSHCTTFPAYDFPVRSEYGADKPEQCQSIKQEKMHGLNILQLNITSMNEALFQWIVCTTTVHVFIIQEHHLRGTKYSHFKAKLEKYFHVYSSIADKKNTGTSGGVMILIQKHLDALPKHCMCSISSPWHCLCVLRLEKIRICTLLTILAPRAP